MTYERRYSPSASTRHGRPARTAAPPEPRLLRALTIEDVADPEYLIATFKDYAARGDRAPGPDGVTADDLSASEAAGIFRRDVAPALLRGDYRPAKGREVWVPKASGGRRRLVIRNLIDRVVSRAVLGRLAPGFERIFLPRSFGFRAGRSALQMVAELCAVMVAERRFVLAVDDVKQAFDNVVVADSVADFGRYVRDARLLQLIETLLRGGDPDRAVGIDQGDPLSPLALNLRLHRVHDRPFARGRFPAWARYVDNVAYLTRSVPEGRLALLLSRSLLRKASLALKGADGPPADLAAGAGVQLLGFALHYDGGLPRLGPGDTAWKGLGQSLAQALEGRHPPEAARLAVLGWISYFGAALEGPERRLAPARVLDTARRWGFHEVLPRDLVVRRLADSHARWGRLVTDAFGRHGVDPGTLTRGCASSGPAVPSPAGRKARG